LSQGFNFVAGGLGHSLPFTLFGIENGQIGVCGAPPIPQKNAEWMGHPAYWLVYGCATCPPQLDKTMYETRATCPSTVG